MLKFINKKSAKLSAIAYVAMLAGAQDAQAGNDVSAIAENITTSIQSLPQLLNGVAYMMGILLAVLGILKIKDHVENPSNAKLQEGAIRLGAAGALFASPIVLEAMQTTIGNNGNQAVQATLDQIQFQ